MIGDQFADIMRDNMTELPMQKIGDVFAEKTIENTRRGVHPSGQPFPDYSKNTNKSGAVRLREDAFSIENTETLYAQANEALVGIPGNAGFTGTKAHKPASEVFYYHQYGKGNNKERRVFPEAVDETSPEFLKVIEKVKDILAGHFNG